MIKKVAFIGLGTLGKPMAMKILKAGFNLIVYDVREQPLREPGKAGARIARSAKEAAEDAELVAIAVLDDLQVEAACYGEEGVMVGGTDDSVAQCHAVFATSASERIRFGDVSAGTAAKIINQILVCINLLAMFGGVSLAERAGLDLNSLQQVLHNSAGQSYMADRWFERIERVSRCPEALRHQWEGFYKTLAVALEYANELGVSVPGTALTQQLLARIVGYNGMK